MKSSRITFILAILVISFNTSFGDNKIDCWPADNCHDIGVDLYLQGKFIQSIEYSKAAAKLRLENNDDLLWKSYRNIGLAYYNMSFFKEAKKYYLKAYKTKGNKKAKHLDQLLRNIGECFSEIGDTEQAIVFGIQATQVPIDNYNKSTSYTILAKTLNESNDRVQLEEAIKHANLAIKLSEELKDFENLMNALLTKGNSLNKLKRYNKAIKIYRSVYNEYIENGDTVPASKSLNNVATVSFSKQNYQIAIEQLYKSLHLLKGYYGTKFDYNYSISYENLADNYTAIHQFDTALLHYQKALINLTNNFRTENIHQNPNPNDSTLFIYSNLDMIRVLHLKATAAHQYYQQNKEEKYLNLANQTYQTLIDFHNKLQKDISTENSRLFQSKNFVKYLERALEVAFIKQLNGSFDGKATFRLMEKNKATVLLQSMNETDALQFANLPDSLLEQEKDLKIAITFYKQQLYETEDTDELKKLNNRLFDRQQQYQQFIDTLEQNHPTYYQLKYQQNETTLDMVQKSLNDQTALLEYFVGDSSIYILSIRKDQSKLYAIEKPKNWSQTFDNFLSTLNPVEVRKDEYTAELFKTFTQNAYALFQNLLEEPLADLNESIINLQIIPDAELNYIPFDLLLIDSTSNTKVDYRTLPYLLKQQAISYAYSAALWLENTIDIEAKAEYSYGGFAASYENNSQYQPLEAITQNVQDIAELLNGKSNTGEEATKANFLQTQQQFNIIQLAMHGILDDENPLNSKLIFTQNKDTANYALQAYELYNMKIPAQLAVLSACETGTGKQAKGEGIMSLSRAFTYAGCNSLIMSLWSIEDKATAQIVEGFFKNLKKGKAKHKALQQAKLNFLNTTGSERTHPIYWAGLVQSGNSEPIDFDATNYLWWSLLLIPFFGLGIAYYLRS